MKSNIHKKKVSSLYSYTFQILRENNSKVSSKKSIKICMPSLLMKIKISEILLCWLKKYWSIIIVCPTLICYLTHCVKEFSQLTGVKETEPLSWSVNYWTFSNPTCTTHVHKTKPMPTIRVLWQSTFSKMMISKCHVLLLTKSGTLTLKTHQKLSVQVWNNSLLCGLSLLMKLEELFSKTSENFHQNMVKITSHKFLLSWNNSCLIWICKKVFLKFWLSSSKDFNNNSWWKIIIEEKSESSLQRISFQFMVTLETH